MQLCCTPKIRVVTYVCCWFIMCMYWSLLQLSQQCVPYVSVHPDIYAAHKFSLMWTSLVAVYTMAQAENHNNIRVTVCWRVMYALIVCSAVSPSSFPFNANHCTDQTVTVHALNGPLLVIGILYTSWCPANYYEQHASVWRLMKCCCMHSRQKHHYTQKNKHYDNCIFPYECHEYDALWQLEVY